MIDTIHYDSCPLCQGSELAPFASATDHLVSGKQFTIIQCKACGFLFTQDAPSNDSIEQYYDSEKYLPHNTRHGFNSFIYRSVRSVMFNWKHALIQYYHNTRGTLIDVGAGNGHFMAHMQRSGWDVVGCEQSELARTEAWNRWELHLDGDAMETEYRTGCADVITAWHAIEHIHDLHGLWDRFNNWLKSDGILLVAVPNCFSADAQHYGYTWAAWDVPRHLWHFSINTIHELSQQHGFRLIDIKSLPLDACYIAMLSDQNKFKAIINGLRFMIKGFSNKQNASSLIYIFSKQQIRP